MRFIMDVLTVLSNIGWRWLSWHQRGDMPYLLEESHAPIWEVVID